VVARRRREPVFERLEPQVMSPPSAALVPWQKTESALEIK
jgi:hypothetical protein